MSMRYLNKIVFINSSSIKYAEVALDGNVHFIGTQGVGKSTLLRTILFFYNADKSKLGIGREKQRFDEYYFPYQNAYIIYEVQHGNHCYCVLAYKVSGKVAFRFIDSPYQRDFFVNTKGWEEIRMALGKHVHYSRLVTRYEEFRQIIYGDNKGLDSAFRKYAIVEAKQYQNIVRTIQNVFLNANLEAKFIKDTIIQSISDEPFCIDIDNYGKNHLKDFERQIKEIRIWFEKDRQGNIPIRKKADKVIEGYRRLNFLQREQKNLAKQLVWRMALIEKDKPRLRIEYDAANNKLAQIKSTQHAQHKLYQNRERRLFSDINQIKSQLKKAKEKQQVYDQQNIQQVLQQLAEKPQLIAEENKLSREKQLLMAQFSQIEEKYKAMINQEEQQLVTFKNQQKDEENHYKSTYIDDKSHLEQQSQELIKQIKSTYQSELTALAAKINAITQKENEQKQLRAELKYKQFYHVEIKQAKQTLAQTKGKIETAKNKINTDNEKLKNLRKEAELAIESLERQYQAESAQIQQQRDEVHSIIETEQSKLQHGDATFYHWLNKNKPDWQENIGKVIDDSLAFNEQLHPRLSSDTVSPENQPSLFGVAIDMHSLESRIKTDAQRQRYINELQKTHKQLHEAIASLAIQHKAVLDNTNKRFRKSIASVRDSISENEYQQSTGEQRQKQQSVILSEWQSKADKEKQQQQHQIEQELEKLAHQKHITQDKEKIQQDKREREIKQVQRNTKKAQIELQQDFEQHVQTIHQRIDTKKQQTANRIVEIKQHKYSELNQGGLDDQRLKEIESSLTELQEKLQFIEDKQVLVIEYYKDKRELFDRVPTLKKEQQLLDKKFQQLAEEQQSQQQKLTEKQQQQQVLVDTLTQQLDIFTQDITAFEDFQKSDVFTELAIEFDNVSTHSKLDDTEITDISTAVILISELKDKLYQRRRVFDDLKKAVNRFTDYFGEGNVFKFATRFPDDTAVMNFAVDLKEFIEENKIAEFEKRVNERFAHIVREIAKETDELVAKETEIEKIIKKINQDFISKNFVDAIKEMEMRTQKSSNPIVQLLLKIKQFRDEHDVVLGERDLFTTDNSEHKNQEAVSLLSQLIKVWENSKRSELTIADSFDLQFRIVENDNDSGWVEKLSHVGSEGTDVLVKTMVNILLLNVFKDSASKKFKDFKLHCMMDEIGRLHPNNVKGILRFANERNIMLINGSPTSQNAMDYRYTYSLAKKQDQSSGRYITAVTRLIKKD